MKIIRTAVAAIALAAGILVDGGASSASADVPALIPVQYVTAYAWTGGNVQTSATATCPSGTRVVSTGAGAPGGIVTGIVPVANFTAATAIGRIYGAGANIQVTVGCAPMAQMSEVTSVTSVSWAGSGMRRAVVVCPSGMRAFGGGGFITQQDYNIFSRDSNEMVSNTVTGDGRGWTFTAFTPTATDRVMVTAQCAPLRGSYVSQTQVPVTSRGAYVYGSCAAGYTAISGGAYLSKLDASEAGGQIRWSIPAAGGRWYVNAYSDGYPDTWMIALQQCIR